MNIIRIADGSRVKNGLLVIVSALFLLAGCATSVWETPRGLKQRFIPIELWAGTSWDGNRDIQLVEVNAVSGARNNKEIRGPILWKHPRTEEILRAYEKINHKRDGDKRQLFALNDTRTGIGRVYDSRPGVDDRLFKSEVMFPLGYWRRGEQRDFRYIEYINIGPVERTASIKIRRLDYTYKGVPHSLKYDWILRDSNGRILFHENYIYSPGKGLVRFRDRLQQTSSQVSPKYQSTPDRATG